MSLSTGISNNSRIAKNTAFLYIRMVFVLIVTLYTSRVVLNTLGVEDFGVYNVVAGFVSMFGFLNATLSASMQRFYNYEGTLDEETGYYRVYCTGLIIHIVLSVILLILLETAGLWYVNKVMVIPEGRLFAANIVYQSAIFSMILMILQIPYLGVIMAAEKMDFYAVVSIADVVLKLLAIIALPYLPFDKLIIYSIIIALVSVIDLACYFIYAKRHLLNRAFKLEIDAIIFKSLMSFSGWNLMGTFAWLLKGQGLNMLLNAFFGPVVNAARGIAYQINGAVSGFSGNISVSFHPQIVNSYAEDNDTRARQLMFSESKICFVLVLLLMCPVIFRLDYILELWLGIVPDNTNIFAVLVLIDSLICTLNTPCTQVVFATGKLRGYQIASSIVNLCLLPVCWILLSLGFSAASAFITTIIFSILNQIVCVWQTRKVFPFSVTDYLKKIVVRCSVIAILLPTLLLPIVKTLPDNFASLLLIVIVDVVIGAIASYYLVFDNAEKLIVNQMLLKIVKRQ